MILVQWIGHFLYHDGGIQVPNLRMGSLDDFAFSNARINPATRSEQMNTCSEYKPNRGSVAVDYELLDDSHPCSSGQVFVGPS